MDEHLATRDDVASLHQGTVALDQRIVALDQKLDLSVAVLEQSMSAMEQRILVRVGSMVAAATVISIAAVGVLVSAT